MINHPVNQSKIIWREKLPAVIVDLLSVFELILTLTIVGCQIGGDFVDAARMNVFIGYWTFPSFMCAWIALSGAGCCCRTRCCGITALVFQCIAIPFALSLVGLDAYFLNNPTQCFFSNSCNSDSSSSYSGYYLSNYTTLYEIKVPLVKGQLAAGVLMFVSCMIFIVIFAVTSYRVKKVMHYQNYSAPTGGMPLTHQQGPYSTNQKYAVPLNAGYATPSTINPPIASHPGAHIQPRTPPMNHIICPNCQSMFEVTT
ncbi:unnamed protein product [Rotaria socialis]|uniref:Uncharacterized protein n=1 Tax=Rotaria socialis TaxID=392032 RepID=A0A818J1Y2_9BILA|nr:unnamed protein product [Rotaria socialis]CAF3426498.1 unnamed protein product [Rotaria socialis]CAF3529196.1 unnamed protein product [Rotaria socialis]CAF3567235.1 unnamed protein product [Rotaria socialis]CAF3777783.1 unnamed protein product [Rotaria socialis]